MTQTLWMQSYYTGTDMVVFNVCTVAKSALVKLRLDYQASSGHTTLKISYTPTTLYNCIQPKHTCHLQKYNFRIKIINSVSFYFTNNFYLQNEYKLVMYKYNLRTSQPYVSSHNALAVSATCITLYRNLSFIHTR
jgi:hypothetical protein